MKAASRCHVRQPDTVDAISSAENATHHAVAPRRCLTMAQETLFHDPDLVRIVPVSPKRHVRSRENFNLRSELVVGHKVGLSTAQTPSDGLRRRDTKQVTAPSGQCPLSQSIREFKLAIVAVNWKLATILLAM
jgi:hypothetical protein